MRARADRLRTRGSRRSRRGGSCGTPSRSPSSASTSVFSGRAGSSATSNMPASQAVPVAGAQLAQAAGERPVQRLGVRREVGAGLAEVAGERLGQHHQVGRRRRAAASSSSDGAVLRRVEAGGALHEPHAERVRGLLGRHASSLPATSRRPSRRGARLRAWADRRRPSSGASCSPGAAPSASRAPTRPRWRSAGVTLLEHVLGALAEVPEVVVVGDEVITSRPVTFVREDPPGGGPAAGLLAGLAGFPRPPRHVVVARGGHAAGHDRDRARGCCSSAEEDGALLVDEDGRRQYLCAVYRTEALLAGRAAAGGAARAADAAPGRRAAAGRGAGARRGRPATSTPGTTSPSCASGSAADVARVRKRHMGYVLRTRGSAPKTVNREPARLDRRAVRRARHRGRGGRGADPRPGPRRRAPRGATGCADLHVPAGLRRGRRPTATPSRSSGWRAWPPRSRSAGTSLPTSSSTRTTTKRSRPRSRSRSDATDATTPRRVALMRAVIAPEPGGPEALTVAELPDPEPGPGEVVIDIVASAVNRADTLQRQGFYPPPPGRLRRARAGVLGPDQRRRRRASRATRSATRCARCSPPVGTPRRWPSPPDR